MNCTLDLPMNNWKNFKKIWGQKINLEVHFNYLYNPINATPWMRHQIHTLVEASEAIF